jgi:hypothetical protein
MGEEGGKHGAVHKYRVTLIIVALKKETIWKN